MRDQDNKDWNEICYSDDGDVYYCILEFRLSAQYIWEYCHGNRVSEVGRVCYHKCPVDEFDAANLATERLRMPETGLVLKCLNRHYSHDQYPNIDKESNDASYD